MGGIIHLMKKIIVVDDNQDILEVTKLILEIENYEVLTIEDPHSIITAIRDYRPELVILDVMMGDIDGRDVCHHLKTSSDTRHIPVLMFSAVHGFKSITENRCAADDFIAKPFDVQLLLTKVGRLLLD